MSYSPDVGRRVVDPVTGLPARLKWLPSIAEVREALDKVDRALRGPIYATVTPNRRVTSEVDPETRKRIGKGMRDLASKLALDNVEASAKIDEAEKVRSARLAARAAELGGDEAAWLRAMREDERS